MSVSAANGAHTLAVLVVEDDFFVRYDIAGCLREAGYAVVEIGSGEEAVALCKSGMPIDMIVTDINLGGSARINSRVPPGRPSSLRQTQHRTSPHSR